MLNGKIPYHGTLSTESVGCLPFRTIEKPPFFGGFERSGEKGFSHDDEIIRRVRHIGQRADFAFPTYGVAFIVLGQLSAPLTDKVKPVVSDDTIQPGGERVRNLVVRVSDTDHSEQIGMFRRREVKSRGLVDKVDAHVRAGKRIDLLFRYGVRFRCVDRYRDARCHVVSHESPADFLHVSDKVTKFSDHDGRIGQYLYECGSHLFDDLKVQKNVQRNENTMPASCKATRSVSGVFFWRCEKITPPMLRMAGCLSSGFRPHPMITGSGICI